MRKCTKCYKEQDDDQFYQNPNTGYWQSWCHTCKKVREQGRRKVKGITPRKFTVVTETHKTCAECKESKPHSEFNPTVRGSGGLAAYCKPCHKERFYDKEYSRKRVMEYRERHSDRWRALHRLHQFNRKSKIKAVDDGTLTSEAMKCILSTTHCFWCEKETPEDKRTLEHIVELNNGGLHGVSNCTMSCFSCNSSRPNKLGEFDHLGNKGEVNDD
jgi:hypothetical protein